MRGLLLWLSCIMGVSCADLTTAELPAGTKNPQEYETREGALALYRGAVHTFQTALLLYLNQSSVLTDEYAAVGAGADSADLRKIPATGSYDDRGTYRSLHEVRGQTEYAINALAQFAPDVSPALRGHLFVLQAYTEILLADLFCSGIPLSTLDFGRDFTYRAGASTRDVYAHALTLLDRALALSQDSVWITHLAQIGRARALLQHAKYAEAAAAVTAIPVTYRYAVSGVVVGLGGGSEGHTIADRDGGNGLPYRSDPRVTAIRVGSNNHTGHPIFHPSKYLPRGSTQPIVVASGVEAELIQAEAALQADDESNTWLQILNALRTDGTFTVQGTDTVWGVGGGAALFASHPNHPAAHRGLSPLADPGVGPLPTGITPKDMRINLLFAERAYWLFYTGQRQGDLRRLVREYRRPQDRVYPSVGLSGQNLTYGRDVTLPITMRMEGANPLFRGCLNRDA